MSSADDRKWGQMERAGPFIDVKLNLPQQRQSGFPPALQTDPYFNLSLRRSIDCCHATPPQELPGWGKVELPHCTPSASCILLELKRGPAHPAPPPPESNPFPPDRLVCWGCCCRGGTVCPARVPGQEITTSAHFDKVRGGRQPKAEKTLHTSTQTGSTHKRGPITTIQLDLKRHKDTDISEQSSVLLQ